MSNVGEDVELSQSPYFHGRTVKLHVYLGKMFGSFYVDKHELLYDPLMPKFCFSLYINYTSNYVKYVVGKTRQNLSKTSLIFHILIS